MPLKVLSKSHPHLEAILVLILSYARQVVIGDTDSDMLTTFVNSANPDFSKSAGVYGPVETAIVASCLGRDGLPQYALGNTGVTASTSGPINFGAWFGDGQVTVLQGTYLLLADLFST